MNQQEKEELERLRRQQRGKLENLARILQEEKELQLLRRQQSSKLEHLARLMQEEETQEDTVYVRGENISTAITEEDHQEDVFLKTQFSLTEEKEYQEFSREEMALRKDYCEDKVKSEKKLKFDIDVLDNIVSPRRVPDENSNVIDEIEISDSEDPGETGIISTSRGAKEDSQANLSFESSSMLGSSKSPPWSPESELKTGIKEYFEENIIEDKKIELLNDKSYNEDKSTNLCTLDWYNSDLNLNINPIDLCSATAMASNALDYLWAGARGTQGVTQGRACYEVRIDKNQPVLSNLRDRARETKKIIRCGWSLPSAGISLGDDKLSFGTGGTFTLCSFGGVIGCYIDLTGDPVGIKYTVNWNELVRPGNLPKFLTFFSSGWCRKGTQVGNIWAGGVPAHIHQEPGLHCQLRSAAAAVVPHPSGLLSDESGIR